MELLTISQIARNLGVPESTVRYYRDRFEGSLPYVGTGRSRRYLPETVDTLKSAMAAVKGGTPLEEIRQSLEAGRQEAAATATATLTKEDETKTPVKGDAVKQGVVKLDRTASTQSTKTRAARRGVNEVVSAAKTKRPLKPNKGAVRAEAAARTQVPIVVQQMRRPGLDAQAYQTMMVSEIKELHEQLDAMKGMLQTLIQEHAELQIGERDKQLVEALKGLQSVKTVQKRRWFGRRG